MYARSVVGRGGGGDFYYNNIILWGGGTSPLDKEEVAGPGQYIVQQPGPCRRHVAVDKQLDQHLHVNHDSPHLTSSVVIETSSCRSVALRS